MGVGGGAPCDSACTPRITNVFYEQYLTVVPEGLFMLSLCLVPTFAVCCLLLGMDLRSGLINLFSIIMILVDTVGFMALWGISYNAVSLINLVTVTADPGLLEHAPSLRVPILPAGLVETPPRPVEADAPSLPAGRGHLCGVRVPHHPVLCGQHQAHPAREGQGGHHLHGQCGEWVGGRRDCGQLRRAQPDTCVRP